MRKNKYHNKKVTYQGITFDSVKERDVYIRLRDMQQKGHISGLTLQPKWELQPKLTETYIKQLKTKQKVSERTILLPIVYTADFMFIYNGRTIVIDVKGSKYTISKDYPLRVKMLRYRHGLDVHTVFCLSDLDIYTQNKTT